MWNGESVNLRGRNSESSAEATREMERSPAGIPFSWGTCLFVLRGLVCGVVSGDPQVVHRRCGMHSHGV